MGTSPVYTRKFWTNKEIERLKKVWPQADTRPRGVVLELFPGRTWDALDTKARKLGVVPTRETFLAPGLPKVIAQFYKILDHGDQAKIANALGMSRQTINRWRWRNVTLRLFNEAARVAGYQLTLVKSMEKSIEQGAVPEAPLTQTLPAEAL